MSAKIERAIISVSDKEGVARFVCGLVEAGVEIFSTGGTRRHLEAAGISVQDIAAYTGFPEMMEGRLKTLHPKVHGGILCRHDRDDDMTSLEEHNILSFPLVVVNLYPFEQTVARPDVTDEEAIENIDIGGPTMIRAAAKNHEFTTVVTEPSQYDEVLQQIRTDGSTTLVLRRRLAEAAFKRTASYDRAITEYFARAADSDGAAPAALPAQLNLNLVRHAELRYGENPHQQAALYRLPDAAMCNLVTARQLNGKQLSYNNLLDLDNALALVRMLPEAGAVVMKHNNPCGAAAAESLVEATRKAFEGDPVSAFGSVLGFNQVVDVATAELLAEPGKFVEAIVAPGYDGGAVEVLTTKPKWKSNVRLIDAGDFGGTAAAIQFRNIEGGMLVQQSDCDPADYSCWSVVTDAQPTDQQVADLRFAWTLVRQVKSNAIVLCKEQALCGAGAGQMSRVDSVEISINKAGDRAAGCVLASDAFFPFPDSIETAAAAGVTAVVQPGGSKGDDGVIAACNAHGLPMIFTGRRHFKH
ncbi:MAG: bifunctional phosphoribosylaminoimidazolecarboxamide formyltransferase/IMP cyclohydrolase [Pirellulales bacterium]